MSVDMGSHECHWRGSTNYAFLATIQRIRNGTYVNVIGVKHIVKNGVFAVSCCFRENNTHNHTYIFTQTLHGEIAGEKWFTLNNFNGMGFEIYAVMGSHIWS